MPQDKTTFDERADQRVRDAAREQRQANETSHKAHVAEAARHREATYREIKKRNRTL